MRGEKGVLLEIDFVCVSIDGYGIKICDNGKHLKLYRGFTDNFNNLSWDKLNHPRSEI